MDELIDTGTVNSFVPEFKAMIESNSINPTEEQKDFLRQKFPKMDFSKKGCKSCWLEAISGYLNEIKRELNNKPVDIAEGDVLVIDSEKFGYDYIGISKGIFICKDVEAVKKIAKNATCYDELSEFAQNYFRENTALHKYLKKA